MADHEHDSYSGEEIPLPDEPPMYDDDAAWEIPEGFEPPQYEDDPGPPPELFDDSHIGDAGRPADAQETVVDHAVETWCAVMAAALQTGMDVEKARRLLKQLRGAEVLYAAIGDDLAAPLRSALSVADALLSNFAGNGEVWLDSLGVFNGPLRVNAAARKTFERVANTAPAANPDSLLSGAVSACRLWQSRSSAQRLVRGIDAGAPPDELAKLYKSVLPPSAIDGATLTENPDLAALMAEAGEREDLLTLSSGFRSLDLNLHTNPALPLGFIRAGQLVLMVAASGSGKTSTVMTVVVAMATDGVQQGRRGRLLFSHNEDETTELFEAVGVCPGGRHEKLQKSIVAIKTTSRLEFVKAFYQEVLFAKNMANETGLPIRLFMPPAVIVDYYQALMDAEDKGNETIGTGRAADLLLYGIANCDPVAIESIVGLSFEQHAGEAWPEGLRGYSLPVLATAQLLLKGNQKPFDPASDDWRKYATATADDTPAWEVRPGDYPLARLDDIRGATKIVQHATTIIGLHRSKPRNNPEVRIDENGYPQLADNRGYFTILKARYGQRELVLPMEFNRQRNGGAKTQYIDCRAEAAMLVPELNVTYDEQLYRQSGDPIIPKREAPSRMRNVSYWRRNR